MRMTISMEAPSVSVVSTRGDDKVLCVVWDLGHRNSVDFSLSLEDARAFATRLEVACNEAESAATVREATA